MHGSKKRSTPFQGSPRAPQRPTPDRSPNTRSSHLDPPPHRNKTDADTRSCLRVSAIRSERPSKGLARLEHNRINDRNDSAFRLREAEPVVCADNATHDTAVRQIRTA